MDLLWLGGQGWRESVCAATPHLCPICDYGCAVGVRPHTDSPGRSFPPSSLNVTMACHQQSTQGCVMGSMHRCSVLYSDRKKGVAQRELAWPSPSLLTDAYLFCSRVLPRKFPGLRRLPAAQDDPHLTHNPQEVWNPIQPGT